MMKRYRVMAGLLILLLSLSACKSPNDRGAADTALSAGFSDAALGETEESFLPETDESKEESAPAEETAPEEEPSSSEESVAEDGVVRMRTQRNYQDRYFEIANASDALYTAVRERAVNASMIDHPGTEYLPMLRFDSADALTQFKNGQSQADMVAFEDATARYEEQFFETNTLFAIYLKVPEKCGPLQVHYISDHSSTFAVHIGITDPETLETEGAEKEAFVLIEIAKTAVEGYTDFTAFRDDRSFSLAEWTRLGKLGVSAITHIEGQMIYIKPLTGEDQTEYAFEAQSDFDFQVGDTVQLVHTGADGSGDIPKGYGLGMKRAETPDA